LKLLLANDPSPPFRAGMDRKDGEIKIKKVREEFS